VGYSAVTAPSAIQFASFTGMFGVSFWIVLANAALLSVFTSKGRRAGRALAFAVIVVAPFVHGSLVMGENEGSETVRVAVIQPNIPGEIKWDARYKSESFDALTELSREAAAQEPDLIVWPETAAPSYLRNERDDLALVAAVARDANAPVLTGCPDIARESDAAGEYRPLNSVLLVGADGTVGPSYNKIRLVPFGEVIPFETVVPLLRRVDFGEADFLPGSERTVFELPGVRVSSLICFESAFPRLAREFVAEGAELLVNVTNDVWYGRTSMPFQHASMAIMRSVENRRSLARSANSGVSMLVDPFGRVVGETNIFERTYLVGELPIARGMTFYARYGDLFPWATVVAGALMLVASAWSGRRSGRTGRVGLSD
jgi:apolipoprotein N-acyltransferase